MPKSFSSYSLMLYRILSYPHPYRVALMRLLLMKWPTYRPHYLACLFDAAQQASAQGIDTLTAIEFGVAGGNGLVALEHYAKIVERKVGVRIETIGFDMGDSQGLPASDDARDLLYLWKTGDYKMDEAALRKRLSGSRLYLGNVAQTVSEFAQESHAPIGACFFDLDYYTSTVAALELFSLPGVATLPRVTCYFDDADLSSPFNGVLGAIEDFNRRSADRKIFRMAGHYHEQTFGTYYSRIMHMHDFKHPAYNTYIPGITATELPLADRGPTK